METDLLRKLGTNIRSIRESKELTQDELASLAGLRRATIADIEAGKSNIEIKTINKIAAAFDKEIAIIFTDK